MKVANRFSVIAAVLAAVICSSALEAVAQEPIIGCVKPGTGLLRIPSGGEGCKAGETPLGFNDLPLLVALRDQVQLLQRAVTSLQQELDSVKACTDIVPECNPE